MRAERGHPLHARAELGVARVQVVLEHPRRVRVVHSRLLELRGLVRQPRLLIELPLLEHALLVELRLCVGHVDILAAHAAEDARKLSARVRLVL